MKLLDTLSKFLLSPLKQDVLILVNIKNRDALGLFSIYCWLKYKYKLKVKIKSALVLRYLWLKIFSPRLVVYVQIDCKAAMKVYEQIKQIGAIRIMFPTETAICFDNDNDSQELQKLFVNPYDYKQYIDSALLPSREYARFLFRYEKINPNQANIIGNPTFDWCTPPLNKLFMKKRSRFKKQYKIPKNNKKILFLATSFSWADMDFENLSKKAMPYGMSKSLALKYKKAVTSLRYKTLESLTQILKENTDWHLVVKAHPFENHDFYRKYWPNHNQVIHAHDSDILELIANTDILIHWNSTTSIQAWGFGKPTVLLDFPESTAFYETSTHSTMQKGNYIVNNHTQLNSVITRALAKPIPYNIIAYRNEYISKWFYKMDGKSSIRGAKTIFHSLVKQKMQAQQHSFETIKIIVNALPYLFKYYVLLNLKKITLLMKVKPQNLVNKLSRYDNFSVEMNQFHFEEKLKKMITTNNFP